MSAVLTKLPNRSTLVPSATSFRDIHSINIFENDILSAEERYYKYQEVTVFASSGHPGRDRVSFYSARPNITTRNYRKTLFLRYGNALKKHYNPVFENDDSSSLYQNTMEDKLRLFAAFSILTEHVPKLKDSESQQLQSLQTMAALMVIDLYPKAAFIHARLMTKNPAYLSRISVCQPRDAA